MKTPEEIQTLIKDLRAAQEGEYEKFGDMADRTAQRAAKFIEEEVLPQAAKLALIKDVYQRFYDNLESFTSPRGKEAEECQVVLGATLAYLLGAIATDGKIELQIELVEDEEIATFLKVHFPADHAVWNHIQFEVIL